ncbi:MAG: T9SS type A sorting domain-containing protein [Flavobacteriales bacterium]|nr:T9SS type A sorting domain-containing protein [Flavobacteriales bacterium]
MLRPILSVAFLSIVLSSVAQVSSGGSPYGLRAGLSLVDVPTVESALFNAEAVAAEDARREEAHLIPAYGRVLPVGADLNNAGKWTDLPNGDRIWRVRILSMGALATELYFDMYLPQGASLFVYSPDGRQQLGAFTPYNNSADGSFATGLIDGESSIVEYYEPQAELGMGRLDVKSVGHGYRMTGTALSDPCEVDVNCTEGASWTAQRDAVVRISVLDGGFNYWCSGSLVNNLAQDCKPYFLTARHCGETATASDFNQWKFYFNYEKPNCGSGVATQAHSMTGCTKRGDSNDNNNGNISGSDYLLLEANTPDIPSTYTPFWAGWDANNSATAGGVGIHHPAGSQKKISTFTSTPSSSTWGGVPGTHWTLTWVTTANGHGVTEGGSSGSPLFNNAKRIVGTLTGGGSCCVAGDCGPGTGPNVSDSYGKMSYHWQSDPGPANQKLKVWLDPASTGLLTMDGSYDPCGSGIGISENTAAQISIGLWPNPATDRVEVSLPKTFTGDATIEILDPLGRVIQSRKFKADGQLTLDLSHQAAGVYTARVLCNGATMGATGLVVRR